MMVDSRLDVISTRLKDVENIIAVSSGKGGVGKSIVTSTLALSLSERGYSVGLLDLDFTSPSSHVILGIEGLFPEEDYGIVPPIAHGIRYMSFTYFSLDKPTPLRGVDVSNSIIELLAITRWGELDYLIIDMPPGIGDAILDLIRLVEGLNFLLVTTPSKVSYETVKKQITLLKGLNIHVIGLLENMVINETQYILERVKDEEISYLGKIDFDHSLEDNLGDVESLKTTNVYSEISKLTDNIVENF
jgi:ATP-binding protein involved in chromosome partitioning